MIIYGSMFGYVDDYLTDLEEKKFEITTTVDVDGDVGFIRVEEQ